jgi:hypothetical protein
MQVTLFLQLSGMDQGPAVVELSGKSPTGMLTTVATCSDLCLHLGSCHAGLLTRSSLQAVLQAVLPPAGQLGQLSMSSCAVQETTFAGCTQLSAVTALHLQRIYAVATTFGMMEHNPVYCLSQLIAQAPVLQRLQFEQCDMLAGLPAAVTGLAQLRELEAYQCSVRDIPAGPYLAGLTLLSLPANPNTTDPTLERLPPALESATELRTLDLSYHRHLRLDAAAADLLAALPHLQHVKLRGVRLPQAFTGRLAERRPEVQLVTS